jgi:hypothetical protein
MSIQIVEIAQPSVIDTVAVAQPSTVALVEIRQGPAGDAGGGSNNITSATTSNGTANLSLSNVTTATATITGMSVAPTAATTTSTTQLATTAFVQQELASGVAVAKNLEFLAHNGTGVTITKGQIVYINGAVSGNPRITLAQANNDTNSARTIGFAKASITNGANGFVISEGELENVSTADADGIIGAGNQIYLSPTTPGAFTRTKPSAPNHLVYVGVVTRASTGANLDGRILVGIQNGYELSELHDVAISSPAAKQVIKRNAGNTLWVNEAIVSADVSDATIASNANTLVLRDGTGGTSFGGTVVMSVADISGLFFEDFSAGVGATFSYGSGAASAHLIALGAGTTGTALFGAATVAAARATLGIQTKTGTSTGLAAVGTTDITGLTGYDLEADTWYKLELQYLWTSTSSNFQINFVTTGTLLRGGTTPANGQANSSVAALSTSIFVNDTSFQLRGSVGETRTNLPAFGYAYFKTGTAGTGKLQLQLLAGTTLSTITSSCAVLTKQN